MSFQESSTACDWLTAGLGAAGFLLSCAESGVARTAARNSTARDTVVFMGLSLINLECDPLYKSGRLVRLLRLDAAESFNPVEVQSPGREFGDLRPLLGLKLNFESACP